MTRLQRARGLARLYTGYRAGVKIHPNGDLYPCHVAFKKMGNLAEKPFREIWFSEESNRLRKDIKEGRHPICWVTCISPLNQYLGYLSVTQFHKLLRPKTLAHILRKII